MNEEQLLPYQLVLRGYIEDTQAVKLPAYKRTPCSLCGKTGFFYGDDVNYGELQMNVATETEADALAAHWKDLFYIQCPDKPFEITKQKTLIRVFAKWGRPDCDPELAKQNMQYVKPRLDRLKKRWPELIVRDSVPQQLMMSIHGGSGNAIHMALAVFKWARRHIEKKIINPHTEVKFYDEKIGEHATVVLYNRNTHLEDVLRSSYEEAPARRKPRL